MWGGDYSWLQYTAFGIILILVIICVICAKYIYRYEINKHHAKQDKKCNANIVYLLVTTYDGLIDGKYSYEINGVFKTKKDAENMALYMKAHINELSIEEDAPNIVDQKIYEHIII